MWEVREGVQGVGKCWGVGSEGRCAGCGEVLGEVRESVLECEARGNIGRGM